MKPDALEQFKRSGSKSFRVLNPHLYADDQGIGPLDKQGAVSVGVKVAKRIRQSVKPTLNKLEAEAMRHFDLVPPVWHPQRVKLRLANGCWYTADFFNLAGGEAVEVKGHHAWEDALVKIKVAAATYPKIKWRLVWKDSTGEWKEQEVLP